MPAFLAVEDNSGENQGNVYFAPSNIHARRMAADEFNDGELDGLRVTRDRGLDQYEEQGWVPLHEMVWRGWWTGCSHCGCDIRSEYYEDPDLAYEPDLRGKEPQGSLHGAGWCSKECEAEWHWRKSVEADLKTKEKAKLRGRVMVHFKDVEWCREIPEGQMRDSMIYDRMYVSWHKDGPRVENARLHFRVPGATWASVSLRVDQGGEDVREICIPSDEHDLYRKYAKNFLTTSQNLLRC